jgi:hypothetical protein
MSFWTVLYCNTVVDFNIYINARENRMGNQEWTIQKQWQHCALKTQDEYKQTTKTQHNTENYTGFQFDFHITCCWFRLTVTRRVPLMEQKLPTFPAHHSFVCIRDVQSLAFFVVFC